MKRLGRGWGVFAGGLAAVWSAAGLAQMHAVKKPETVVRAVGVYEWTGDLAKPAASRLIPVTLFIDGHLEDAGVYLARPVPMALETGTIFELDQSGVPKGLLDLAFARHLQPSEESAAAPYDDGWFGYGQYKPLPTPKLTPPSNRKIHLSNATVVSSKPDTAKPKLSDKTASSGSTSTASTDPDRPTMRRRDGSASADSSTSSSTAAPAPTTGSSPTPSATSSTTSNPSDDPNRPTMKRRDDSTSSTTSSTTPSSTSNPADDPDRPTMKRRDDSVSGSGSSTSTSSTSTSAEDPDRPTMKRRDESGDSTTASSDSPANDPDRPTLKKRTPAERRAAQNESASVTAVGSLNDDPNRPSLHRGKPTHAMTDDDLPKMIGLPVDLHQMVAVSDAVNRPPHDFSRPFENAEEHDNVQAKMRDLARAKLAAYIATTTPATGPTPAAKPAPKAAANTPAARAAARKAKAAAAAALPPVPLTDEVLKGYTLSYGGAPTYAYSASSAAPDGSIRYVTVIAQAEANDELRVALSNVTDSKHLDRTPRLRLVDVVDAEASNRASLLFEARAQQSRSFVLYRVIGAEAEQVFSTGSTQ